ncbi:MAG: TetR/AcrR family transcriptional regulator [Acidobacteria bacterium]|nr:TetR/AcrR family transcriptional regulator [Acidobacteriota bacterium]
MGQTQRAKSLAAETKILDAALHLFSRQGFQATSVREIAELAGVSVGNVYHHFGNKEAIFQRLIDRYWEALLDPDLPLNQVFRQAQFPDDLELAASAIEQIVDQHQEEILLIYVDVIEFRGEHIRTFYETMADRFQEAYADSFAKAKREGRLGDIDPMVAVMTACRWLFYFFTVEKCFGVPMHLGRGSKEVVDEFIRILRYGVLPRDDGHRPRVATDKDGTTSGRRA